LIAVASASGRYLSAVKKHRLEPSSSAPRTTCAVSRGVRTSDHPIAGANHSTMNTAWRP